MNSVFVGQYFEGRMEIALVRDEDAFTLWIGGRVQGNHFAPDVQGNHFAPHFAPDENAALIL